MSVSGQEMARTTHRLPPVDEGCEVERRADSSFLIRRTMALGTYGSRSTEPLLRWAREAPNRVFMAQRPRNKARGDGAWEEQSCQAGEV